VPGRPLLLGGDSPRGGPATNLGTVLGVRFVGVSALSHDGLVRDHNEDSLVVGPWTLCASVSIVPATMFFPIGTPLLVAVADGLGGHPAGEDASSLVVAHLARVGAAVTTEAELRDVLQECNRTVYAAAELDPERTAMGTTVAGLVVGEAEVLVFNVGDSRVYAVEDGGIRQLSVDDNEAPARGQARSPVVTQTLGGRFDLGAIDPHITSRPSAAPSRYLVCSDGLTDPVDERTIAGIVRDNEGGEAVFVLWQAAIQAGAPDNVTVALVEISEDQVD
jgi:PPM family protein phosphatase